MNAISYTFPEPKKRKNSYDKQIYEKMGWLGDPCVD